MTEGSDTDKKLSRRQFVGTAAAGAAVLGAVAGVTALAPQVAAATVGERARALASPAATVPKIAGPVPIPSSWDGSADVIVVGLGAAGGAAALMAAGAGAQVLVLEKMAAPGGCTALSYGAFAAAGTTLQAKYGIVDTPGKMFDFWTKAGMGATDPDVLMAYCENSSSAWLWLANLINSQTGLTDPTALWSGLEFSGSTYVTPSDVIPRWSIFNGSQKGSPVTLPNHGAGEFAAVYNVIKSTSNIQVMLSTPAVGLVTNNGEVVGVQAIANDTLSYFQAKRAVVLTTGDYSRNDDMTRTYSPFTYYAVKATALGSTGDGIRMAQQVGADLCCMGGTMATSVVAVSGTVSSSTSIYVNNRGQRFVNEDNMSVAASQLAPAYVPAGWTSYYPGFAVFNQDQMQAWAIFDTAGKGSNTLTAPTVSASTIPALATALGVNPTALTNTVNLWNADAANKVDTLYGRPENFFQLSTPPYYATPLTWETILAHGGLKINASTQVLDTFGYPIPRLYAAGSTTGGIMGRFYQHSGGGIGSANTLGRIAGTNAAAETPWA